MASLLSGTALLMCAAHLPAASFRGLGVLPGGAYYYSSASDVSADGAVVVGESLSANGTEAFRWTEAIGMMGLGALGGADFVSTAHAVSADGLVVVGSSQSPKSGPRTEAFRWTEGGGMIGIGDLPGGEFASAGSGVSSDGSVLAGGSASTLSPSLAEAYRWTESTGLLGLGVFPAGQSPATVPWSLSADGTTVVGWAFTGNGQEAFRWTEIEGLVAMGDLPEGIFSSQATGVSADGSVIVGLGHNPGTTTFRWTAATGMQDLGRPPGGNYSLARGVSGNGSVVVGEAGVANQRVPMIWNEENGMRNLIDVLEGLGLADEIAGWSLEQATAISADGLTVVGSGYNPAGEQEAWIAYLGEPSVVEIPAASSVGLALLAGLLSIAGAATLRLRG